MKARTRLGVVAAAATTAFVGLAVTTMPSASAAPICPDGKYCLYDRADYTMLLVTSDKRLVPQMAQRNDNRVSSIINNTDTGLHLFPDPGFGGFGWVEFNGIVPPGTRVSLATPRENNNTLSSYFLY